jgi:hypothetical protein
VRELVDQRDLRAPGQDRVDVHLGECRVAVGDLAARHDLQAREHLCGVLSAVRLDEANGDIRTALRPAMTFTEHGVGLADTRSSAEIDPQLPATHETSLLRYSWSPTISLSPSSRARGCPARG